MTSILKALLEAQWTQAADIQYFSSIINFIFKMLTKHKPENLDQISALMNWPDFNCKIYMFQNVDQISDRQGKPVVGLG